MICTKHNLVMTPLAEVDPLINLGIPAWVCKRCNEEFSDAMDILDQVHNETEHQEVPE